ncbi:E3 ubiquitin-protein ligase TRIM39-like [Lissotriton helveticus]
MAAASQLGSLKEEATCSICLGYFTDPVTIDCGHNFCSSCITQSWEGRDRNFPCPQCREISRRKKLRPNRQLGNMVDIAKQLHLPPVKPPEENLCEKHEEKLRLFCAEDQMMICLVCRESKEHKTHSASPIEEAAEEHKVKLQEWLFLLKKEEVYFLESKLKEEDQYKTTRNKLRTEKNKIESEFEKLRQLLKENEQTLHRRLEEMEKKMTMIENANITKLSNQITALKALITEIEKKSEAPAWELLKNKNKGKPRAKKSNKAGAISKWLKQKTSNNLALKKHISEKSPLRNWIVAKGLVKTMTLRLSGGSPTDSLPITISPEKSTLISPDITSLVDQIEELQPQEQANGSPNNLELTSLDEANTLPAATQPSSHATTSTSSIMETPSGPALVSPTTDSRSAEADISSLDEILTILSKQLSNQRAEAQEYYLQLREDNNKMQSSLQDLTAKIGGISQETIELQERVVQVEETNTKMVGTVEKHDDQLKVLQLKVEDLENRQRRSNLRLFGIPERSEGSDPRAYIDVRSTLSRCDNVKIRSPEMVVKSYKVMVTLDPDTAHPGLLLSEGGRRVRGTDTAQRLPDTPKRFTYRPCVLGSEGFTSGRHYWEVELLKEGRAWRVGVAAESVNRKGDFPWCPEGGVWAVGWSRGQYLALTSPQTPLSLLEWPLKLGVYLDYEGGRLSLYNADSMDSMELLFSFPQAPFTERLFPLYCLWGGAELRLV